MARIFSQVMCNGIHEPDYLDVFEEIPAHDHCRYECLQSSNGSFLASETKRIARQYGWRIREDEWYCPRCIRRKKWEKENGQTTDG